MMTPEEKGKPIMEYVYTLEAKCREKDEQIKLLMKNSAIVRLAITVAWKNPVAVGIGIVIGGVLTYGGLAIGQLLRR